MNSIHSVCLLLAIFILTINCEEQFNQSQEVYVPIYEINYRIAQERVPHVLIDLVMKNAYINSLEFQQVISDLNVTITELFIWELLKSPGYEDLLKKSQTSLITFIQLMINQIPEPKKNLRKILELFGIDYGEWTDIYLYGKQDDLYKLIETAQYDNIVLEEVYMIANTSHSEIAQLVLKEIIEPITHKTFVECLKIFGKDQVVSLLNETLCETQVSAIRNDSLISEILTNYTNIINSQNIWVTETQNGYVSIPEAYGIWKNHQNYIGGYLQNVQNHNITRNISNIYLGNDKTYSVIEIGSNDTTLKSNIAKASDYNTIPENCVLWRKSNETLTIVNATEYYLKGCIIYVKHLGLQDTLGSPFICDGKLYGMLINEYNQTLHFLMVGDADVMNCDLDDDDDDDDNGASTQKFPVLGIFLVIMTYLL